VRGILDGFQGDQFVDEPAYVDSILWRKAAWDVALVAAAL
jgi:hypothetical protein